MVRGVVEDEGRTGRGDGEVEKDRKEERKGEEGRGSEGSDRGRPGGREWGR